MRFLKGDYEAAEKSFIAAQTFATTGTSRPLDYNLISQVVYVQALLREHRWVEAQKECNARLELIEKLGDFERNYFAAVLQAQLGEALLQRGDRNGAIAHFNIADDRFILNRLVFDKLLMQHPAVLKALPNDLSVLQRLVTIYTNQGRPQDVAKVSSRIKTDARSFLPAGDSYAIFDMERSPSQLSVSQAKAIAKCQFAFYSMVGDVAPRDAVTIELKRSMRCIAERKFNEAEATIHEIDYFVTSHPEVKTHNLELMRLLVNAMLVVNRDDVPMINGALSRLHAALQPNDKESEIIYFWLTGRAEMQHGNYRQATESLHQALLLRRVNNIFGRI